MGVQHQNIHDKSREGSWGFNTKTYMTKSREGSWGFNTKIYMTSPGRVLGGVQGGGFNTKTYMTNPGRVLGGSTPKHT